MLKLKRRIGEKILIYLPDGTKIEIVNTAMEGKQVCLGFTAPDNIKIYREELLVQPPKEMKE